MRGRDYTPSWHEELLPRKAQISQVIFMGLKLYLLTQWKQKEFASVCTVDDRNSISYLKHLVVAWQATKEKHVETLIQFSP